MNINDHIVPFGEPLPKDYEILSREELKLRLQVFISHHLETNFEKLCAIIYRHDVSEEKFNVALQEKSVSRQASMIADLVIEREMQKVKTRKAYRKYKEDQKNKDLDEK